jgi:hypothetical protein
MSATEDAISLDNRGPHFAVNITFSDVYCDFTYLMVYFRLLFQDSFGETEEKRDENLVKDNL